MVYQAYKHLWKPVIKEKIATAMEPDNVIDKSGVCVK